METIMKYQEMKKGLKAKAVALREIKVGLKESQRVYHFNTYVGEDHVSAEEFNMASGLSPEQRQLHLNAWDELYRCLNAEELARRDYRARHIAMSLFRGKTPEQIESNYVEGKWDTELQLQIDIHLKGLYRDNPPLEYEKAA